MDKAEIVQEVIRPSNGMEYVFLILIASLSIIVCFWMWIKFKKEDMNNDSPSESKPTIHTEIALCKSRIDELGREFKEMRDHLDHLMSKHSDSSAEIVDRIATINEKVASLNTLISLIKERCNSSRC